MTRTFIQTTEFSKCWDSFGLDDDDLRRLEYEILTNPKAGPVIRGTGKLRKMRFSFEGRGKSRSTRVCYVDFPGAGIFYLITIYEKKGQDNLTAAERSSIRKMIQILERSLTGQ